MTEGLSVWAIQNYSLGQLRRLDLKTTLQEPAFLANLGGNEGRKDANPWEMQATYLWPLN